MNGPNTLPEPVQCNEPAPADQTVTPLEDWAQTPTGAKIPAPHYVAGPHYTNRSQKREVRRKVYKRPPSRGVEAEDLAALELIRGRIHSRLDKDGSFQA